MLLPSRGQMSTRDEVMKVVQAWEEEVGVKLPFGAPADAVAQGNLVLALKPGEEPILSQGDLHRFPDLPEGSFVLGEYNGYVYLTRVSATERIHFRVGYRGAYPPGEDGPLKQRITRTFANYLALRARPDVSAIVGMDSMGPARFEVTLRDGSTLMSKLPAAKWTDETWSVGTGATATQSGNQD